MTIILLVLSKYAIALSEIRIIYLFLGQGKLEIIFVRQLYDIQCS